MIVFPRLSQNKCSGEQRSAPLEKQTIIRISLYSGCSKLNDIHTHDTSSNIGLDYQSKFHSVSTQVDCQAVLLGTLDILKNPNRRAKQTRTAKGETQVQFDPCEHALEDGECPEVAHASKQWRGREFILFLAIFELLSGCSHPQASPTC